MVNAKGPELRRALFSLKRMFQVGLTKSYQYHDIYLFNKIVMSMVPGEQKFKITAMLHIIAQVFVSGR